MDAHQETIINTLVRIAASFCLSQDSFEEPLFPQACSEAFGLLLCSDEDGDRLVIDQDRASSHASPTKPAKRIRLLDSDLSDDDNDLQNMDTSALSYKSGQLSVI